MPYLFICGTFIGSEHVKGSNQKDPLAIFRFGAHPKLPSAETNPPAGGICVQWGGGEGAKAEGGKGSGEGKEKSGGKKNE